MHLHSRGCCELLESAGHPPRDWKLSRIWLHQQILEGTEALPSERLRESVTTVITSSRFWKTPWNNRDMFFSTLFHRAVVFVAKTEGIQTGRWDLSILPDTRLLSALHNLWLT